MKVFGVYEYTNDKKPFDLYGFISRKETPTVYLDTSYFFSNQWNASLHTPDAPGVRLFDWYERIVDNKNIKTGYYLEPTPGMLALRAKTHVCGYCGKLDKTGHAPFWHKDCVSSPYLKENELYLTRFKPITEAEQSEAFYESLKERAESDLLVEYHAEQNERKLKEREKAIAELIRSKADMIKNVEGKVDGSIWLLQRGINKNEFFCYCRDKKVTFLLSASAHPRADARIQEIKALLESEGFIYNYEIKY